MSLDEKSPSGTEVRDFKGASHTGDDLLVSRDSPVEPKISVVLPALNEEAGIAECIKRIKSALVELGVTGEIIVSDSSDDRTAEIAAERGAFVVHPDKSGYGYAYRYAFEYVRGEYVAIGDADCTYDFEELPQLFRRVVEDDGLRANGGPSSDTADLVLGSRFLGDIEPGAMPALHRYVGNPVLTGFLNAFYDAGVSDAHSGFRVLRRDALEEMDLASDGMEFASEMVMEAAARGYDIAEVPITYRERAGTATINSFRDGWRHVRFMLLNAPGYLFSVPGVLIAALGVGLMTLAFFDTAISISPARTVNFGVRTMVGGSLLTLVGYQIASLGVFATVASDPIRRPSDPITSFVVKRLRLEVGATIGALVLLVGSVYAGYLGYRWLFLGYESLPALTSDIFAFTAIVLGVQTVFGSFFLSALGDRN